MKGQKQLFSSVLNSENSKDSYETPEGLFQSLNNKYGYTIDLAASDSNHLVDKYFTEQDNALIQDWGG